MKLSLTLCGLLLLVAASSCSPIAKREAVDDLSPLNENEDDNEERGDRDKRKIGVIKLGVSNGIINFVFGKLDAFLDAKTKALTVLDEGNKAKNAAFEIDNTKSATSEFITKFISQKLKATTGSVGPLVNAGTTFLTSAKQGIAGAFVSKFAPLSSLSGGLAGGLSGGSPGGDDGHGGTSTGSNSGSFLTGLLGTLSGGSGNGGSGGGGGLASLSSLSGGLSGGSGGANNGVDDGSDYPLAGSDASSSAGYGGGYDYTPPNPQQYYTYGR